MQKGDKGRKRILIIEDQPYIFNPLTERLSLEYGEDVSVEIADSFEKSEALLKDKSYFLGIIGLTLDPGHESKYFFPEDKTDFEGIVIEEKYKHKFEHYCFLTGTVQKLAVEALGHDFADKAFSKSNPPSFGEKPFPQNILDYIRSLMSEKKNGK